MLHVLRSAARQSYVWRVRAPLVCSAALRFPSSARKQALLGAALLLWFEVTTSNRFGDFESVKLGMAGGNL